MMAALKVMTYFKVSLSTHNWDRAFFLPDVLLPVHEYESMSSSLSVSFFQMKRCPS